MKLNLENLDDVKLCLRSVSDYADRARRELAATTGDYQSRHKGLDDLLLMLLHDARMMISKVEGGDPRGL